MKRVILILIGLLVLASGVCAFADKPVSDRAGNPVSVPENCVRVISLAPSTTRILEALGMKDSLVAVDTYSPDTTEGLESLPHFDMMRPDIEAILSLEPDLVFTTGMSSIEGDPYAQLIALGVCVCEIPTSDSLDDIMTDILFIGACVGKDEEAALIVGEMRSVLDDFAENAEARTEKKTVFFEVGAMPYLYSFGTGVYLNELIELAGAVNVLGSEIGWLSVSEETAVAMNPDVILTSVDYLDDPVAEILARPGWENVNAVKNGEVYLIDSDDANLPDMGVLRALKQIAESLYP